MSRKNDDDIRQEFEDAVNMSASEIERWLATKHSQNVGWTYEGEHESVGHQSERRIVEIKGKRADELTDEDYAHMRKVTGYVHRHLAQGPQHDIEHSRWRYSLMNWGHDPMKERRARLRRD